MDRNRGFEFAGLREESLRTLAALRLTDADLDRRGRHPQLGEVTLGQLLACWTAHDLGHIAQIVRAMAKQYAVAVGPWEQYLSILHRWPAGLPPRPPASFAARPARFLHP